MFDPRSQLWSYAMQCIGLTYLSSRTPFCHLKRSVFSKHLLDLDIMGSLPPSSICITTHSYLYPWVSFSCSLQQRTVVVNLCQPNQLPWITNLSHTFSNPNNLPVHTAIVVAGDYCYLILGYFNHNLDINLNLLEIYISLCALARRDTCLFPWMVRSSPSPPHQVHQTINRAIKLWVLSSATLSGFK